MSEDFRLRDLQWFPYLAPALIAFVILVAVALLAPPAAAEQYSNITVTGLDTIDMVGMLLSFISAVLNATVLLPFFLAELGVPQFLNILIVAPVWYCYLAALVQLTTGRILPLFE